MFDHSTQALLKAGCALIVGTVASDGAPHASRGWGLVFVDDDGSEVRLMLDADDEVAVSHADAGAAIAITGADVPTLRSVQIKGTCVAVEPATEDDYAASGRFRDAFYTDIEENDGTPRVKLERLTPHRLVAVVVAVRDVYDQTPGPKAGEAMQAR
jgi:hypothetical protein